MVMRKKCIRVHVALKRETRSRFFYYKFFFLLYPKKKRFVSTHVMDRTIKIKERFAIRNHH